MKNSKPFEILLDIYDKECAILYDVVCGLNKYTKIQPDNELEGKLLASAFAFICSDFLETTQKMGPHQDFPLFVEEMKFKKEDFEFFKKGLFSKTLDYIPESFDELVFAIIQDYIIKIKKDLRNLFETDEKLIQFFSSIFSFNNGDFIPEMAIDSIDFFKEFK
uniref:hypothetical protein n=1 Tax=Flavobacterium sp. TaxID=239 RepID=UPI0040494DBA